MTAHGWFHKHKILYKRPMILAAVSHPDIQYTCTLPFVIDTGAERTLIVPRYEDILKIRKKAYISNPYSIDSIGGPVFFRCLPKCTIVFTDYNHCSYPVKNISVHFFCQQRMKKVPLLGKADYPNILGRDVLDQVSLGYCQQSEYLFVTKDTENYGQALFPHFPQPFVTDEIDFQG